MSTAITGLPNITINFTANATTIITRSQRGIVFLVLDDTTATGEAFTCYADITNVNKTQYTAENYLEIRDAFLAGALKVYVLKIGHTYADLAAAETAIDETAFNWITYPSADGQQDIVDYVKARNLANPNKPVKAVVFNVSADDAHIVDFANTAVIRSGAAESITGLQYMPRLAGLFAAIPFTRSTTYYRLTDIDSVTEVADNNAAITAGKFIIINDYGEPKVGRGVNSLTTVGTNQSISMKKITIVEAMDMIKEDIFTEFKNYQVGQHKNDLDGQNVFVAYCNNYFLQLAKEGILDHNFDNNAYIDVATQRQTWIDSGTAAAAEWSDDYVRLMTYQSQMFMAGDIKILDALEDLTFTIAME